jgi:hypothetical protein
MNHDSDLTAYVDLELDFETRTRTVAMGVCVFRAPNTNGGVLEVIHTSTIHAEHPQKCAEHLIEVERKTSCRTFVFDGARDYVQAIRHYMPRESRLHYRVTPL